MPRDNGDSYRGMDGLSAGVSEAQELATLGVELRHQYPDLPLLAMVDGSLIYWFLDSLPDEPAIASLTRFLMRGSDCDESGFP